MTRAQCAVGIVCALALSISAANAKPRQQLPRNESVHVFCAADQSYRQTCPGAAAATAPRARVANVAVADSTVIGRRPQGCPYKFCGCEASLYLFGKIDSYLNRASNWIRRFPRTSPAPGMVAARPGHVFVLISHAEDDKWLVHDGNSGGGLTRQHVRSIRNYTIVNPNELRVALR